MRCSPKCVENMNSRKFGVASAPTSPAQSTREQYGGASSEFNRLDLVACVAPACSKVLRLVTVLLPEKHLLIGPGTKPRRKPRDP
jgi:hypothetical protein